MSKLLRILLIEDDPGHARLIQEMLKETKSLSFVLQWAARLSDGLASAQSGKIDLVLLDLSLPDGFGADTFHRVTERLPNVPIVILSSNDDAQVAQQLCGAGACAYLVKGQFDPDSLGQAIGAAVR